MGTRVRLLVLGLAACVMTPPVSAVSNLFGVSFSNYQSQFDGSSLFVATDSAGTFVDVYRNYVPPTGASFLLPGLWNVGGTLEDFLITMTVSNITATSADGIGTFSFKDLDGDIISGNISGVWTKKGDGGDFNGSLSNVTYTPVVDGTFDGHLDSVSMVFPFDQPWNGSLLGPGSGAWFTTASDALMAFTATGSLDFTVEGSVSTTHAPVPGALVLALFGMMSVAGLRRRRSL